MDWGNGEWGVGLKKYFNKVRSVLLIILFEYFFNLFHP